MFRLIYMLLWFAPMPRAEAPQHAAWHCSQGEGSAWSNGGREPDYTCKKSSQISQGMTTKYNESTNGWTLLGICGRDDKWKYNAFTLISCGSETDLKNHKQSYLTPLSRFIIPVRCAKSKLLRNCWLQKRQSEVNITRLSQNRLHPQNICMEMMLSPSISHEVHWIQCFFQRKMKF